MPDQIQRARQRVQNLLTEFDAQPCFLSETALIRDGQYCGHRFSIQGYDAVCFFEENEIKVYDANRHLLKVETLNDEVRRAA